MVIRKQRLCTGRLSDQAMKKMRVSSFAREKTLLRLLDTIGNPTDNDSHKTVCIGPIVCVDENGGKLE